MDEMTAAEQPVEYLESLLEILACPLDNSVPLSAVRNAAGEIVALRSGEAEYPVVHNVPCLIPGLGEGARGDLPLWQAHQSKMWREYLPFRRELFDGALYASTIYHQLDPPRPLRRVHSILKPMGKLFVWYTASRSRRKYWIWRGLRALGMARMYDEDYQWAFTRRALRRQLERAGFVVEDEIFLCEACSDLATCKEPNEYLAIAHRV